MVCLMSGTLSYFVLMFMDLSHTTCSPMIFFLRNLEDVHYFHVVHP